MSNSGWARYLHQVEAQLGKKLSKSERRALRLKKNQGRTPQGSRMHRENVAASAKERQRIQGVIAKAEATNEPLQKWLSSKKALAPAQQRKEATAKLRKEKTASRDWKHLAWEPGGKPPVELQDLQAEKQAFCGFYQKNAVERNLCFELTLAQFVEICEQGCHYCLSQPKRWPKQMWTHHGIDRKDNRVGYVLSNCLPCCSFCNRAKGAAPYDEFLAYLARVVKNRQDLDNRPSKIRPQPSKIGPQQVSVPDLFKTPWGRRF